MTNNTDQNIDFDPTKPVQTRDGRAARIICTDRKDSAMKNTCPIVALVTEKTGAESYAQYQLNGRSSIFTVDSDVDLINIPKQAWVNFYQAENGNIVLFASTHSKTYRGYATKVKAYQLRSQCGLYSDDIYHKYISTVNIFG